MYKADVTYMNNPYMFVAQASRRHSAPSRALRLEAHVRCPFTAGWNLVLVRELFINFTFKLISKISRFVWFGLVWGFWCFFYFLGKKPCLDTGAKYNFRLKHTRVSLAFSAEQPIAGSWNCHLGKRRGKYRSPSCLLQTEVSAQTLPGCCSGCLTPLSFSFIKTWFVSVSSFCGTKENAAIFSNPAPWLNKFPTNLFWFTGLLRWDGCMWRFTGHKEAREKWHSTKQSLRKSLPDME